MALETAPVSGCTAFDPENDRAVTIDKLLRAINASLYGCRPVATATETASPTETFAPPATATDTPVPTPTSTATEPRTPTAMDEATQTPTQATATASVSATETEPASPLPTTTSTETPTVALTPTSSQTATALPTLTATCPPTGTVTPIVVAHAAVPAGGYAFLSSHGEFELEQLATTIEVESECEEIFVEVVLGIFSDRSECQFPGCMVNVRLSTSGFDDVVGAFSVGDPNRVRSSELNHAYMHLAPGNHTFRVSMTPYGMTWVPSGYLEIRKR
jgi:hypothetical protein